MNTEKKYIITKRAGHYRHYRFPTSLYHANFARDTGYKPSEVIETGLIIDGSIQVLECHDTRHSAKAHGISAESIKARECKEYYNTQIYRIKEGD
jgi:hypothetical protein